MRFRLDYTRIIPLGCECCSDVEYKSEYFATEIEAREEAGYHFLAELFQISEDGSEIEIDLEG